MTNSRRATCAAFTLLTIVFAALGSGPAFQSPPQHNPGFDRTFSQRFNTVSIENPQGRIQVQTWSGNRLRVMAWSEGATTGVNLEARIRFQITSPEALGIVVRTQAHDTPINLSVIVPRQISLYVKGGSAAVDINGATAAFSVVPANSAQGVMASGAESGAPALDQADATSGGTLSDGGNSAPKLNRSDPPVEVIKIDTRLVNLNVRVTDGAGKLIPDLRKDDFQIFENNIEQEVVEFEPVTSPVNLVLLLDLSGSTRDHLKTMKKAAKKFIDSLKPNTRIGVAAFTRRFMVISDFTDDRKLLRDRIDDIKNFNSGTAFYDASWSTLDLFKEVKETRKAIVMLTDGVDNSISSDEYEPRHPFAELLVRITQEEVTIYPIYFDTEYETIVKRRGDDTHEAYMTARKQLQSIADESGGTLFRADRAEDLEGAYQRVASELETLYSVAYNPRDKNYDGGWRNVSVRVKRPQGMAKTKRGFYAK